MVNPGEKTRRRTKVKRIAQTLGGVEASIAEHRSMIALGNPSFGEPYEKSIEKLEAQAACLRAELAKETRPDVDGVSSKLSLFRDGEEYRIESLGERLALDLRWLWQNRDLPRLSLFREVNEERTAQDAQHGGPAHDDLLQPGDWCDLIRLQLDKEGYRERLVKVAAVAIAAIEAEDRRLALKAGEAVAHG